jgi:hypothetical protein
VLELVHRYPTAACLATATADDLGSIPYLPAPHIDTLLDHARHSVATLCGVTLEELVRDHVRQLRDARARQKRLENLLGAAYHDLPTPNSLNSIRGIGDVTAAVLTACMVDIDRFDTPNHLVAYFGVLPIEVASGVDRDGQPRGPRRWVMSRRGNDLVRRYLWMAGLSAIRCNPAVRALYARVVAKHPQHKAIAVGHAMRKLLHLVFAIWKTGRPFNPDHYPWQAPAHAEDTALPIAAADQAAGHTPETEPALPVVTAACTDNLGATPREGERLLIDFAHIRRQLSMDRVLDQLGLLSRLRGSGPQRRGACPRHRGDARGRTFSVSLADNVFQCFDPQCGQKGDIIDLWAEFHGLALRDAAVDLMRTFSLQPAPGTATEKRNG